MNLDFNIEIAQLGEKAKILEIIEFKNRGGNLKEVKIHVKFELISSHTYSKSFWIKVCLQGVVNHLIMQISVYKIE